MKYPGMVRLLKDGHTYLLDGLNLDLGGHLPDAGREEDAAQKAALYTPEKEEQRGDMPGKVDEAKWSDAKAKAKKEYPDLSEENPRHWKIVSTIYKNMGGKFSEQVKKSLETVEALEKITPTFILDPRLWLSALRKSGVDYRDANAIFSNLGLTIKCYAEMGGQLVKSSMLEKAGSHKYAERVAKPGGGFRYIYPGEGGEGRESGPSVRRPAPASTASQESSAAKKGPKSAYAKTIEAISSKNDADARASLQNVSYEHLTAMHAEMKSDDPKRKMVAQAAADKKQAAVRAQAKGKESQVENSQLSKESVSTAEFTSFQKKNSPEVKASLRKSHPEWDAETLESRTVSQLRQLFKLQ